MNLTVFGATGGIGRHVVNQALDAGHQVTAYARNPAKLNLTHPNLTVIAGELSEREAVGRAVAGADAVISALGPSLDRKATGMPLVEGTRTIVDAMRAEDVERYSGIATPSPRDTRSRLGRIVPFMGRTFLKRAYRELLEMSQLVTDTELDWTIARFTRPTDGARTGTIRAGYLSRDKIAASITRADIAGFLLAQTSDGSSTAPRPRSATDGPPRVRENAAIGFHATGKPTLAVVARPYPGFLHELSIDPNVTKG